MTQCRRPIALAASAVLLAVAAVSCGDSPPAPRRSAGPPLVNLDVELAASLESFEGCPDLLRFYRQHTAETRTAFPVLSGDVVALTGGAERDSGGGDTAASGAGAGGLGMAAPEHSTTNVQEADVDEPDIVKADGRRIVMAGSMGQFPRRLFVVAADGGAPEVLGSVDLPEEGDHQLFLEGDRALVLTRSYGEAVAERSRSMADSYYVGPSRLVVTAVDLSDERAPRVVEHRAFEGELVNARLHDGRVRIVLRSNPTLPPVETMQAETEQQLAQAMAESVQAAELEDFLPGMSPTRQAGAPPAPTSEPLVPCDEVRRPPEPSGSSTVTVLTLDADGPVKPLDAVAVVADAQTVYASTDSLYVATNEWLPPVTDDQDQDQAAPWRGERQVPVDRYTTAIHAFDLTGGDEVEYVGSGRVAGQLLNQWSLSEHEGYLRVATTEGNPWAMEGAPRSESFLTVLERRGDRLERVGSVGGLGRGETIQSVRYVGDTAYVVTFRQTDPLYVLDLSEPAAPEVLGELKVTGFSSYLHPVSGDRLLGVGQAADEEGRTQGLQVSLFDVSDAGRPSLVDRETVRNGYSPAEHDHRAFLWWARDGVAVVPASSWDEQGGNFNGAIVYAVSDGAVDELGRVVHDDADMPPEYGGPGSNPEILRSTVVGGTLYTLSPFGVLGSDLGSLDDKGWVPLHR